MHALISKAKPLCLHMIFAMSTNVSTKQKEKKPVEHQLNFKETVNRVKKNIETYFPQNFKECEKGELLAVSKNYVDKMLRSEEEFDISINCVADKCDICSCRLQEWKHKSPRSYLITLGMLSKLNFKFE